MHIPWCLTGALLWACGQAAEPRPGTALAAEPARPDVVWISVDALRADHGATPALERLAADGQRMSQLFAHAPSSLPSHAALFTSRPPLETGVLTGRRVLDEGLPLLAEWLAGHGYRTAAVLGQAELWPAEAGTGLERGFERVVRTEREVADAAEVLAGARELLDELGSGAPRFLFVHFADPHPPHRAHGTSPETAEVLVDGETQFSIPVLEDGWWEGDLRLPPGDHLISVKSILPLVVRRLRATLALDDGGEFFVEAAPGARDLVVSNVGPEDQIFGIQLWAHDLPDAATAPARYRLEVEHADRAVGKLLDELDRRGLYQPALVLLTSGHGQALGEHGQVGEGASLHDELLHVPWILKLPAGHPRRAELAEERDELARAIDVAPTVLDLLGLPELPGQSGSSLFEGTLRVLFAEAHPPGSDLFCLRDEAFKLVLHGASGRFELFDLAADAGETRDVFSAQQAERADWQQVLTGAAQRWRELAPEPAHEPARGEGAPDQVVR
jgi:hypothetical protein